MSEKDETYEFLEAHEVLRDMRRQLEVAQGLDAELEKFRWEIPPRLAKDDGVFLHMCDALSTISVAAALAVKNRNSQISLKATQSDISKMKNFSGAQKVANRIVESIEKLWCNENATYC
ncbi:hypothetical protein ERJ75_001784200 [Trypanosoma vivax]|nr:hypothetical protein ERJ75_001784200 [Trypanosoma vivax]